ncbi:MAG: folate-binding protein [Pseudomonadota bacterium]
MSAKGFVDETRAVIAVAGQDARDVLQGIVTNDVDKVAPGQPVYAALLTPQGKYLFDFFLLDPGQAVVLIDVSASQTEDFIRRLSLYCLRRDARAGVVPGLQVGLAWGAEPEEPPGGMIVADPRAAGLGWRVYGKELALDGGSRGEYDALRVAQCVPESGIELVPGETFILEAGFERLGGVDFRKGCYVGQEVTARMKHKTELRKGLVRVAVDGAAEPGTPIVAGGKAAGTLFTQAEGTALAHLRFDRAGHGMEAGDAVVNYTP